ncbi:hypothetical protein D3C72_1131990 [compost metagenome]
MREKSLCRLPRQHFPGLSAVCTSVNAVLSIRNSDIDRLCIVPPGSRPRIKGHPDYTHQIIIVIPHIAHCGKTGHLAPGCSVVGTAPQSIAAPGPHIDHTVIVRINRQPFAHRAARHISAQFERQFRPLPSVPFVRRPQQDTVHIRPVVRIRP